MSVFTVSDSKSFSCSLNLVIDVILFLNFEIDCRILALSYALLPLPKFDFELSFNSVLLIFFFTGKSSSEFSVGVEYSQRTCSEIKLQNFL